MRTPNLDALANRGTTFTKAWTPSPICVPARASLATGRWVHELDTWDSAQPYDGVIPGWANAVRAAGGHAVSIGKLHFKTADDDYGFTESLLPMHVVDGVGWVQGLPRVDPLPFPEAAEMAAGVGTGHTDYTRYDQRIADRAVEWLDDHGSEHRPWALFVSLVAPHYPLSAPPQFTDPYLDLELPLEIEAREPSHSAVEAMADFFDYHNHFDDELVTRARQAYLGLCTYMDHNVGRVLDALDRTGNADDTLVIYTSDHGEMAGNRGLWGKSYMYEDSLRIPMIVAGPGVPAAAVVDTPTSLIDVHPTVVQTLAPEWVDSTPGTSLVELAQSPQADRVAFSEYHDGGSVTGSFAVQQGRWKYVHHVGHASPLFDMIDDTDELIDLGTTTTHTAIRESCMEALRSIVDPEAADARAFASQGALIARYGGRDGLGRYFTFNHTPTPM